MREVKSSAVGMRSCVRGCTVKGEHFAVCLDNHGRPAEGCKGCAPASARDGDLLCPHCYGRALAALYDVPDLVGAIRARANPLRAQVFDKVMVSGSLGDSNPAPVDPDLVEAAHELTAGLQRWAAHVAPHEQIPATGLRAGVEADDAREIALEASTVIVDALPRLANDAVQIVELCRFLLEEIPAVHGPCLDPVGRASRDCVGCVRARVWTVRAALSRWPLVDRAWWAAQPCPFCSLRAVRVTPARRLLQDTVYECQGCGWARSDSDSDGPWPLVFSRRSGESRS